ncbi:hypothetical protein BCR32DRAFT_242224 [Anaeromyces robustus]|uniref:L domain-like protein n=1 Tax=Anaeromyces robustus TaxID=1754192 RepID=A0A1Y1XGM7_9FUNG|nr:hypothetical protein BCR32DRAFT_242224 [Anaeromyces robustus]|eukprot:ORX84883.1 hypothetical protein BCR32DRAFT_242224 [Anaeromyces robustus]
MLKFRSASNNKFDNCFLENIVNIKTLEYLSLANTNVNNIPNSIFLLSNLSNFDISYNPQLSLKIIKFKNSENVNIDNCNFINTNILCYQSGTCKNNFKLNTKTNYKECSNTDIEEINTDIINIKKKYNYDVDVDDNDDADGNIESSYLYKIFV